LVEKPAQSSLKFSKFELIPDRLPQVQNRLLSMINAFVIKNNSHKHIFIHVIVFI